ncbi:MAG: hypothetical protein KME07_09625 [Pegethrix bostrychoides GSE-TBD4-15B]|jgi:uncharacterized membrane protein|uniref:Glycosyltransferase RgtA/B/C/D-like domain-containing protein n=1 Tax=Pegethrix bostrychoides GSE-TBD4-15B TaxID=2839662 RepID=A0A951PBZ4_9CYAN|nr:hypothetical protein [Pegethrix bostrychoides GSE-TBD4-15B]
MNLKPRNHYLALAALLLLGLSLRFWQLDSKPLWLDEVLTGLFTRGHSSQDLPLNQFLPLSALDQIFSFQPNQTCAVLTHRLATESVHPPLFFCLLYGWMDWLRPENWIWAMRALPALFGVAAVAASYWLNRVAFSPVAGLLAAALMAVSPFAVYLSQEARHYTLPMLMITLALAALVQMQQDLVSQKRLRLPIWLGWSLLNLLGLYIHYFCLLAFIAQVAALSVWLLRKPTRYWIAWGLSLGAVGLGYLPWIPMLIGHFSRPETNWLIPYKPDWLDRLEPIYQTLAGWTLMVIALPVENQPRWIAASMVLITLGFLVWLVWQLRVGFRHLWQEAGQRPAILLIASFTGCILLQFFAIVYLLDKDLTVVPRYNFVYYPGICALLAACLSRSRAALVLIGVGVLSSLFVVNGLVFQKSYHPTQVARRMAFEPQPVAMVMTYESPQEIALGLSFALELRQLYAAQPDPPVRFALIDRSAGYSQAWRTLEQLDQPLAPPLNLWAVASPGMRTKEYPQRLTLNAPPTDTTRPKMRCQVDPDQLYRQGFPYQLFRCLPLVRQSKASSQPDGAGL